MGKKSVGCSKCLVNLAMVSVDTMHPSGELLRSLALVHIVGYHL